MRLVRIVALTIAVLGCAAVASANTIWNFNNVVFNRPGFGTNTVTGSITLIGTGANVVTGIASYDFTVAGANAAANFHYVSASSAGSIFYSAHDLAFFGPGFNPFVDFLFAADLTNA